MPKEPMTIGRAIDQIISALDSLDERSQRTVLAAVESHLGIGVVQQAPLHSAADSSSAASQQQPNNLPKSASSKPSAPEAAIDIRTLKSQKKPQSARQMTCLVGYYLQELAPEDDRKDTIGVNDLEKYFKQAGYPLPGRLSQVLIDCKKSGYIDSVSRGVYKLNAVGYNLAVHKLPDSGADE